MWGRGGFTLCCHTTASQEGGGQNESPEQLPILPLWDICYLIRSLFICLLKHPVGCRPAGEIVLLWSDTVRKWTEDGRRFNPNELWGCFHQQVPGGILHHLSALLRLARGLHCQVVPFSPGGKRGELIVRVLLWGLVRGCCAQRRNSLERGSEIHFRWQITARGWTPPDYLVVNETGQCRMLDLTVQFCAKFYFEAFQNIICVLLSMLILKKKHLVMLWKVGFLGKAGCI